jgi:VanZ family protein
MIGAVVWLSVTPAPLQLDLDRGDKLGHFLGYAALMFWFSQLYVRRALLATCFVAMGVALELVQGTLGYRSLDALDMLANAAGVLAGWAAAVMFPRVLPGAGTGRR